MTHIDIVDAYVKIRETNNTIPDEVLDFMKDAALTLLPKEISKIDEAKFVGEHLLEIARETRDTILAAIEEKEKFAISFLKYVEDTFIRRDDQYYFKHNQHVHRNIIEVMECFKYFLEQNEKQRT